MASHEKKDDAPKKKKAAAGAAVEAVEEPVGTVDEAEDREWQRPLALQREVWARKVSALGPRPQPMTYAFKMARSALLDAVFAVKEVAKSAESGVLSELGRGPRRLKVTRYIDAGFPWTKGG